MIDVLRHLNQNFKDQNLITDDKQILRMLLSMQQQYFDTIEDLKFLLFFHQGVEAAQIISVNYLVHLACKVSLRHYFYPNKLGSKHFASCMYKSRCLPCLMLRFQSGLSSQMYYPILQTQLSKCQFPIIFFLSQFYPIFLFQFIYLFQMLKFEFFTFKEQLNTQINNYSRLIMIKIINTAKSFPQKSFSKLVKPYQSIILVSRYHASKDQRFVIISLRLIDFDAKYLNEVPYIFKPLQPIINSTKQLFINFNEFAGLPLWMLMFGCALIVRIIIFPLILVQMKKMAKLGPVAPVFVQIKDTWKDSQMPFRAKLWNLWKIYRSISKQQNFRFTSMFVYNIAYYPFLITMIYSIRKVLSDPRFANQTFLHIQNFADIDPYFLFPTLTIALYYYNFQRFITPENKDTLITKIRHACQLFLIVWYPFLCCWPSGIVIYMFANAIISVAQTNLLKSPWFLSRMSQKITIYGMQLSRVEYDKGTSEVMIQAIKSGQELSKQSKMQETELLKQTQKSLLILEQENNKLQQQDQEEKKKKIKSIKQHKNKLIK